MKKSFIVRIHIENYKALEKWAGDEFRSVNGQVEFLLEKALKEAGRKKGAKNEKPGKKDKTPGSK